MSGLVRRPRLFVFVVLLVGTMLAGSGVVFAATMVSGGKAVTAVRTVTENSAQAIVAGNSQIDYVDLIGMSTTINVPSDTQALLIITFSAANSCVDGSAPPTAYCLVRVLVDGNLVPPGVTLLRGSADGSNSLAIASNSMQFVYGPVSAGTHTVKVQGKPNEDHSTFNIYGRTLTVLRSKL